MHQCKYFAPLGQTICGGYGGDVKVRMIRSICVSTLNLVGRTVFSDGEGGRGDVIVRVAQCIRVNTLHLRYGPFVEEEEGMS